MKRLNAGGIWRFNPDTRELDVFARGWINPWGHAFDKYGQSFVTDGANGEGINHVDSRRRTTRRRRGRTRSASCTA